MDSLPEEIVENMIFHRLSIKSLGVCMCVNKYWHSLIKNPSFVSSYNNMLIKTKDYVLCRRSRTEFQLLSVVGEGNNSRFDFYKLFTLPRFKPDFFGFDDHGNIPICKGMLCLTKRGCSSTIMLWNPTIRKLLTLPKPNLDHYNIPYDYHLNIGMWFDSLNNDYKVIRILCLKPSPPYNYKKPFVEIFSLNDYGWKFVHGITLGFVIYGPSLPLLNGALHWIGVHEHVYNNGEKHNLISIFRFDVTREIFEIIYLPQVDLVNSGMNRFSLAIYKKNSIALCGEHIDHTTVDVWVQKEYAHYESWTRICSFKVLPEIRQTWVLQNRLNVMMGLLDNGELVWRFLYQNGNRKMVISIDPESGLAKRQYVFPSYFKFSEYVRYFEETLVLLDNPNAGNSLEFEREGMLTP